MRALVARHSGSMHRLEFLDSMCGPKDPTSSFSSLYKSVFNAFSTVLSKHILGAVSGKPTSSRRSIVLGLAGNVTLHWLFSSDFQLLTCKAFVLQATKKVSDFGGTS